MKFFDPAGDKLQAALDVRHYKWLVALLAMNGTFSSTIPRGVRD